MKIAPGDYRVPQDARIRLGKRPTRMPPFYRDKEHYREFLERQVEKLSRQQELLYASNRYALLLIFQGMDTAGKDGVIRHVMSGVNPQGCQAHAFRRPSASELLHDFLWRGARDLPERGRIGLFNRSYYEEVLVVRVHPELLLAQGFPEETQRDKRVWPARYRSIVNFENHLFRNGTRIVKFFLHMSRDEQRKRLLERIDDPEKSWKFNPVDVAERGRWPDYMDAYSRCIEATSTRRAPWYIVPADDKENARIIVSQVVVDTLEKLDLRYPKLDAAAERELQSARAVLAND